MLATGTLLTLSACLPDGPEPERPDPDLLLRRHVAAEVSDLVAAYAAVVTAFPQAPQVGTLRALAAEHEAHVAALTGPPPSQASASPSATPAPPTVPSTVPAALRWLTGLERAAATRRSRQSLRAGADLARLLAAVGACETTHAVLLAGEAGG